MVDTLGRFLPLVAAVLAAVLTLAIIRTRLRHDRAMREIRASLEETERLLEELGWRQRGVQHDEEAR